jgi:hypothetical protein
MAYVIFERRSRITLKKEVSCAMTDSPISPTCHMPATPPKIPDKCDGRNVRLTIKQELDEPGFFRAVRVGNWIHWFSYATGGGAWTWNPDSKISTLASDCKILPCLEGGDFDVDFVYKT